MCTALRKDLSGLLLLLYRALQFLIDYVDIPPHCCCLRYLTQLATPMADDALQGLYQCAKAGQWEAVLAAMESDPLLGGRMSRHIQPGSGWMFLHQAAFWGHTPAARLLVGSGACILLRGAAERCNTVDPCAHPAGEGRTTPADVARAHGHVALAELLQAAVIDSGCWAPDPADPSVLPSSYKWSEACKQRATRDLSVTYAGAVVRVRAGGTYYTDSMGRVLVGWHGTGGGMDGEPMVEA